MLLPLEVVVGLIDGWILLFDGPPEGVNGSLVCAFFDAGILRKNPRVSASVLYDDLTDRGGSITTKVRGFLLYSPSKSEKKLKTLSVDP